MNAVCFFRVQGGTDDHTRGFGALETVYLPANVGNFPTSVFVRSCFMTNALLMTRSLSIIMSLLTALNTTWAGSVCAAICCPDEAPAVERDAACCANEECEANACSPQRDHEDHNVPVCDDECCAPVDSVLTDVDGRLADATASEFAHCHADVFLVGVKPLVGLQERHVPLRTVKTHVLFCTYLC